MSRRTLFSANTYGPIPMFRLTSAMSAKKNAVYVLE